MFDVNYCRQQFPAFQARPRAIFLDGPGGTQVPQRVIDAIVHYLTHCNANHGGVFATSRESDAILHKAHVAVAELLNAPSDKEIVFGPNMTTLTLGFTRSIAKTLKPGDEIVVTKLDHDGNVSPWLLAARDAGATVRWIDIQTPDCTLDLDSLRRQLNDKTRWVAVGCASNAAGTINDVAGITRLAHAAGAKVFLDAVHYAPHGPIDVQAWDCDALACSAYKFFGPHIGILWARRQLLEELPAYKLRPAADTIPDRWMTGTQNHECIAGVAAAVEYLHDLGKHTGHTGDRRSTLRAAMTAIQSYETELGRQLLEGIAKLKRFEVWGIADVKKLAQRVPTVSITLPGTTAEKMARQLAERDMYAWNGNMYAINLSERLGLENRGGFLRLGLLHYNTHEEVERLLAALAGLV
ncbi:MAG TPA: cysteine desulfurase-like protein [Gemmataceae bacterium]|nr:cysteine desulfurase-like protein [Gemmataceae bacterium]